MGIKIASDKLGFKRSEEKNMDKYQALKNRYDNLIKEHVDLEEKFHTVLVDNYHLAEYVQELEKQHEDSICYERELVEEWNEQQRMIEEQQKKIEELQKEANAWVQRYISTLPPLFKYERPDFGVNPYQE